MVFDAGRLMFAFHLLLRECPRTSVAVGFSYTQNQEQPLNPTTASTLAAYRDELEGANFADDMVAHLVMDAARELVANEGLTVKASELECGENKSGEPESVLPKGILDVYQSLFDEQKKRADGIASKAYGHQIPSVRGLIQAVGDLSAMIPGVEPVGDASWKILAPYYEDVWDRYFNLRNGDDPLIKLEQAVRAAGFHRAATYERLNGTYRNSNTHPKLADPRTLADQRWESARFDLMVAYVERHGKSSRPR
jgi:hypothetical protein